MTETSTTPPRTITSFAEAAVTAESSSIPVQTTATVLPSPTTQTSSVGTAAIRDFTPWHEYGYGL